MTNQSQSSFRILSLDGGGIKGVFGASFLKTIEEMSGKSVVDHFDLIAGTSTGGILALALGLRIPPARILEFYCDKGPLIFPCTGVHQRLWSNVRRLTCGKHDSKVLLRELRSIFGDATLAECRSRLVVPAFNAVNGQIHLFKTPHHERFRQDYRRSCVDVAMATSAAPTFFCPYRTEDGSVFVDGGVWANNPIMVALQEAIHFLGADRQRIDILSIGTTNEPFSVSTSRAWWAGLPRWAGSIVPLLMQAQADASLKQATLTLTRPPLRVSPIVEPNRFRLDDSRQIKELRALGVSEARSAEHTICERFLRTVVQSYNPHSQAIAAASGTL